MRTILAVLSLAACANMSGETTRCEALVEENHQTTFCIEPIDDKSITVVSFSARPEDFATTDFELVLLDPADDGFVAYELNNITWFSCVDEPALFDYDLVQVVIGQDDEEVFMLEASMPFGPNGADTSMICTGTES